MSKRYLDCTASEIQRMTGRELAESIAGSEGRVLVCETIGSVRPMLGDVTNAEFASAMGADMLILNLFDVDAPVIQGLPDVPQEDMIREVKRLTGRAVGINLEPVQPELAKGNDGTLWQMSPGRLATAENACRCSSSPVNVRESCRSECANFSICSTYGLPCSACPPSILSTPFLPCPLYRNRNLLFSEK